MTVSNSSQDSVDKNLVSVGQQAVEHQNREATDMQSDLGMWKGVGTTSTGSLISRGSDELEIIIRGKKFFSASSLHLSFPNRKLRRVIVAVMEALDE